jgi:hypothetical protein
MIVATLSVSLTRLAHTLLASQAEGNVMDLSSGFTLNEVV